MTVTQNPASTIDGLLAVICGDHGTGPIWADDAVVDAVVPNWRLVLRGRARIEAQCRTWYREPAELEELRRHPVDGGEVVELTLTWTERGVPHAARQVHVLEIDADGRISRDHLWCGGKWPAELLAKMEAASNAG
jgi:hypothetical protein